MRLQATLSSCLVLSIGLAIVTPTFAQDVPDLIKVVQSVGGEGQRGTEAAQAWQKLSQAEAKHLVTILAGLDNANPLAANYLRSAVETIADRSKAAGKPLPLADIEKFLHDTSHDPRARRLAYEMLVAADPKTPDRLLPNMLNDPSVEIRREAVQRVMDAGNILYNAGDKAPALPLYKQAMAAARDEDQVTALVKRLAEYEVKVDVPKHFGFLMTWRVIGPFDNTEKKGFDVPYPPEKELNFAAEYEGKGGAKVKWTEFTGTDNFGVIDLKKAMEHAKGSAVYAATEFESPSAHDVEFRLGSPNAWKVWLNGQLLFGRGEYHRGEKLDQYRMKGSLKPGKNTILIKICQNEQTEDWAQRWQFRIRVCDGTGTAILQAQRP